MKLIIESDQLEDYLKAVPGIIEFDTPYVKEKIQEITSKFQSDFDCAEFAFKVARDEISHTFDTKNKRITISAEETLKYKEGICFAKSHLLAALLRGMHIPAGFCYQRVLRKNTIESGYALHGLVALYIPKYGWFRVDPRGNKSGIDAQFTTEFEQLAYPIRPELGEVDYPNVLVKPLDTVIESMRKSEDCPALFYNRPEAL